MRRRRFGLVPCLPAVLACLVLLAGCGGDDDNNPVVPQPEAGLPPNTPQATTPVNLLARFEATYEYRHKVEFGKLLTADYRFAFSSQSDPELVAMYGDTWDQAKELASLGHLIAGFTSEQGDYRPAASEISFTFEGVSVIGDPDHADSTDHYRLAVIPRILGHVSFADGMEFVVDAPHDLYLVRGDAAVLASGQNASADRWYVRRWEDRSPALVGLLPASPVTIGGIKAAYLQ